MMEFVEPDAATRRRQRHQVGRETTVVRLAEIAVAEDQRIGERYQLPLSHGLAKPEHLTRVVAKQRHLRRRRLERGGRVGAAD